MGFRSGSFDDDDDVTVVDHTIAVNDSQPLGDLQCKNDAVLYEQLPLGQAIRTYPKVVGYVLALMTGTLFVGYDSVIVGTVTALPAFQTDFGDLRGKVWVLPARWVALWSALGPVGSIFGGILAGWLQDWAGRRVCLATGSVIGIVTIGVMYASNLPQSTESRQGTFLAGKLLQGSAVGVILAATQTYVSEVVPTVLRGPIMGLIPTFILLGQMIGGLVILASTGDKSAKSYLVPFASQWPFVVALLIAAVLIPESPAWLIRKDRLETASKMQRRLHRSDTISSHEFEKLKDYVRHEQALVSQTSYWDCFRGTNRRRTEIVMCGSLIPTFFGLPILSKASYFIQQVGMKAKQSIVFLILGIALGLVANGVGLFTMTKFGRRTLVIASLGVTTLVWLSMGIAGIWQSGITAWYTAICLMVIVVVNGLGAWPASYAISAEASSLQLRGKTQAIGVVVAEFANAVFGIFLPYLYNPDAANLKAKTGFVYSSICLIALAVSWLLIPEMKGRSALVVDKMFEDRLRVRDFKSYVEPVPIVEQVDHKVLNV